MSICTIFCAAGFDGLAYPIPPGTPVIAADGGLRHTQSLGLTPDIILGDFDSLGHIPTGAQVFPVEKDDTDAMLAIKQGLSLGCDTFYIYGALDGKRLDHTIANLQSLLYLAHRGATGYLIGKDYIIRTLSPGRHSLPEHFTGILSLFCLGADATGITIQGAKYETQQATLTAGFPLGVSNHFTGKAVTICLDSGTLLAMWDRENGLDHP